MRDEHFSGELRISNVMTKLRRVSQRVDVQVDIGRVDVEMRRCSSWWWKSFEENRLVFFKENEDEVRVFADR